MEASIFFCHGSRDPAWREPFERLIEDQRRRAPSRRVELAFLELMSPTLEQVIDELSAAGCDRLHIVPLFLAPGAHTRRDLPALVASALQRHPGLQITTAPALLESADVRAALVAAIDAGAAAI